MAERETLKIAEKFGFKNEISELLPEIEGSAHVFTHKTGARLLFLENKDNNKSFSITFKTPAADDTGVFHILEHSVLCGSEKYPVKEPFVNLLKSSMQTFLNAMTFPDKTMYPVASTNDKDLLNLTSVYLDAVFHPNIYTNKRIFEQEGWHLEFDPERDGSLEYNGVVFNEMKGALSDSESVMFNALSAALFPDTTYRFEAGGTPEAIPTLTYESFLENHTRHYRPSNSHIVIYGDVDLEPMLELIDNSLNGAQNDELNINPLNYQSPVQNLGVEKEMATSPDSSCTSLGFVVGKTCEREKMLAIQIILDSIMGSNEAPMKKALLGCDIADEIDGFCITSLAQPFMVISARGLHGKDATKRLQEEVAKSAKDLSNGALDEKIVEAALNHAEFQRREGDFRQPDGVQYSMAAMLGWLYDDSPESSILYIRYEECFKSLRDKLGTGYYADLIKEIFLENDHIASSEVVPVKGDEATEQEVELKELEARLSPEELDGIVEEAAALHEAQMTPDSPKALATLPKLSRKDVGAPRPEPKCSFAKLGEIEVLRHEVETHGIVYAAKYFDIDMLTFEELPYVALLAMVLGKMDTSSHTASQIDTLTQSELGSLSFSIETFCPTEDSNDLRLYFVARASCLSEKTESLANLVTEILTSTIFNDSEKLENILTQYKVAKEQQFIMSGDGVASTRAASYTLPSARVAEQISNIDFYKFVKKLLADFDASIDSIVETLDELLQRLFQDEGCLLSFAGTDKDFETFSNAKSQLGTSDASRERKLIVPAAEGKQEAFAVPADIAYCALSINRDDVESAGSEYSGLWMMASRVLTYDYLWNEVRVVGGAYGVRFISMRTGMTYFSSFRDPNVDETFDRFRASGEWLANYSPEDDEFEGFVVSVAASFDKPMKPKELIRMQTHMHLGNYPYEEYLGYRQQVLDADLHKFKALAKPLSEICSQGKVCVVGNKALLEQADLGIPVIDLFDL